MFRNPESLSSYMGLTAYCTLSVVIELVLDETEDKAGVE